MYSTELNEHFYSLARMIKESFTFLELIQLIPKMTCILLSSLVGSHLKVTSSKSSAGGYHHTHLRGGAINAKNLCTWLSDVEIDCAAVLRGTQAGELLLACRVYEEDLGGPTMDQDSANEGDGCNNLTNMNDEGTAEPQVPSNATLLCNLGLNVAVMDDSHCKEYEELLYAAISALLARTEEM
jgi:hypothetical protein